jgi:hypothetical protein
MAIVGCVKSGPKKASYEPWKGSPTGRRVDTLRSLKKKKKAPEPTHCPQSPHVKTGTRLRWIPRIDTIMHSLLDPLPKGRNALIFFEIFYRGHRYNSFATTTVHVLLLII